MLSLATDKTESPKGFLSNLLKLDKNIKDDKFSLLLKSFSFGKTDKNAVLESLEKLEGLSLLDKLPSKEVPSKSPLLQLFNLGKEELSDKDNIHPDVFKTLPTKDLGQSIKQLIGDAKEYLKEQITLKTEIKELPKTLGGLIKLAEKSGIDIKEIKFDSIKQAPLGEELLKSVAPNREIAPKLVQTLPHTTSEIVKPIIVQKSEKETIRPLDLLLKRGNDETADEELVIKNIKASPLSTSLSALLHTDKDKLSTEKELFSKLDGEKIGDKTSTVLNNKTDYISQKATEAKQLIQHTAHSMREAVENYKPPFTRIKMQLNPQKFGEMDVTLIQRGNNVHININASSSALTLMMQNAHELKTALSAQGLGDASMNFSSHQQQQQDGQKRQEHAGLSYEEYQEYQEYEEEFTEIATALEVVVPRYI